LAQEKLAELGYEPTLGARPLLRAIQRQIEDPLSEKVLTKEIVNGDIVKVDLKKSDNKVTDKKLSLSELYDITETFFSFTVEK
jgi:ATP-dependent Clp protease ATP-binding subunit ClpC